MPHPAILQQKQEDGTWKDVHKSTSGGYMYAEAVCREAKAKGLIQDEETYRVVAVASGEWQGYEQEEGEED